MSCKCSLSNSLRFGRTQVLTIDQGQFSLSLVSLSNAQCQFTCILLDSSQFGCTQALTNDLSSLIPSSIARRQFPSPAAHLTTYRCEQPLDFPNINILVSPTEKSVQSINSGCCNLRIRNWLSSLWLSLPRPFKDSDFIDKVQIHSFLGFLFRHCLLQASCIASSYCMENCSPHRRCVILDLQLHWHLILRHDFKALNVRCGRKILPHRAEDLWLIIGFHLRLRWIKPKSCQLLINIILRSWLHLQKRTGRGLYTLFGGAVESESVCSTPVSHKKPRRCVGGGCLSKTLLYSQISDYLVPGSTDAGRLEDSVFRYVAYVDDVELLKYSSSQFVHTIVPLVDLFAFLTVTTARKIAAIHKISAGSRCTVAQLMMFTEYHSCFRCHTFFMVFSIEPNPTKLTARRVEKCRAKTGPRKDPHPADCPQKVEFPPPPADYNLTHTILSNVCSKMKPENLEEAGCAVCGELRPVGRLSHLKGIRNLLSVVEARGVTWMERKSMACPVREYLGPVLDHSCSQVCDICRSDIWKGKVPRLALANNLWIRKVPEFLQNLRYIEKILVARVRHTCAYVKVASGMRKMMANIIAFESPTQKIYTVLPPPRDDIDDVLAILFTGPSKPTPEDFAQTPFLVR